MKFVKIERYEVNPELPKHFVRVGTFLSYFSICLAGIALFIAVIGVIVRLLDSQSFAQFHPSVALFVGAFGCYGLHRVIAESLKKR